ncbi:ABC transporter ATP-binding protein [Putridiphycobacter roseus]|uniref:ABC transporter ATP-binding protein n=1 Tax=Putridiphycobacter roseus TaxID=2219161 RepID=A0A2W1NH71_9FLAO|nr:ABC transporter ATP-binding protein [Putridiphycobacter roseus]PZE17346.1 ABC transporter ATP-binding protein [Putridiphycobacter roseus]
MFKKYKKDLLLFRRLLAYLKPYKGIFYTGLFLTVLLAIIESTRPLLIVEMVNIFIESTDGSTGGIGLWLKSFVGQFSTDPESQLMIWVLLIFILLLFEALFQFIVAYLGAVLGQSVILDVREKLFKHIQSFRLKYFDKTPNGTVVTRLISDIEAISDIFTTGLISILGDLLKLVAIFCWMFYVNWQVTLLILIPIPLLIIATRIFAKAMKAAFEKERTQVNKLNTFVQEHISGMSIVQLFNKEKIEAEKFDELNKGHRNALLQAVWATSLFFPVVEILSSLSIAVLILWSMLQLNYSPELVNNLSGIIFGYILWVNMLYRPIRQMADRFNILQRGVVRADRVFAILDSEEVVDNQGERTYVDFNADVEFKNVWFAYNEEDWVLKGVDIYAPKQQSIALVGTTGAGKSTIINLLTRFYDFQKGEITIGGTSIKDISLNSLRRNIAIVLQDVFLFSDTLYNNITMGDTSITREMVIEASKKVGAHEFIMKLPGNYDYDVKERGGLLSVGQKQLVSFIRAYVYNPKILILDEATASLDSESEAMIQKATAELQKGRTSIVIAHRLSTIVNSSQILVISKGTVIEKGNHNELIQMNGQYKKLYDLNFV